MNLRVKKGGSIMGPDGKVYKGGAIMPPGLLTKSMVLEHVRSGYLEAHEERPKSMGVKDLELRLSDEPEPAPPGVRVDLAVGLSGQPKVASKWARDPDSLRGMDLDSLNVMVAELDDSVPPFETQGEAVAFLSQDYEAPVTDEDD